MAKSPASTAARKDDVSTAGDAPTAEPTVSQRALANVAASGIAGFKVKRQLSFPLLKQGDNETVAIRFVGVPYVGKEIKNSSIDKPALMIKVNNLATGGNGVFEYILNSVLFSYRDKDGKPSTSPEGATAHGILAETFGADLDGICVVIKKFPKDEGRGKKYNTFEVVEVEAD